MQSIGIIAEYNPLHTGHAYQLSHITERWPTAVRVVVMSGSFVQRGGPAFFSKFLRAHCAVLTGADLVIELPALFAVRSAEIFAAGAIRLLAGLGLDAFSFGSEITNLDLLTEIAATSFSTSSQHLLKQLLKEGKSYREALCTALSESHPLAYAVVSQPNALLGLEYLRAIQAYNVDLLPLPLERKGTYHAQKLSESLPSATALRQALAHMPQQDVSQYFPEDVYPLIRHALDTGQYLSQSRYEDLLLYKSRSLSTEQLSQLGEFGEGMENRWHKKNRLPTWNACREELKSKRYTYARIDRMASYTVLNWQKNLLSAAHCSGPGYARILAFNTTGRNWLKHYTGSLPLVTKWGPFVKGLHGLEKEMAQADIDATNIQALCFTSSQERYGDTDFTTSPLFIP